MAKQTLNDRVIKALKPAATGKRREVWDALVPGLGIRVTDTGAKSFVLVTRYPGSSNPARRALGSYGELTLEQARTKARRWLQLVERGVDPYVEVERERAAEQRKRKNTFAAVAEDFINDKLATERRGKEVQRDIRREFIPVWGNRAITDIGAHDVRSVVKAAKDRGAPYQAHNLLGYARRLFSWAIDQHVYGLESSPCDRLKPKSIIGKKESRKRILSEDELRAFWRASTRLPYPYGPLLRILLLTGQRHREVADAKRSEFHPDLMALIRRQAESDDPFPMQTVKTDWKLWSVGEERFKSDAPHMVPLTDDVIAVLADLSQFRRGDHLFSTTFGEKPTVISDKIKSALDARMLRTLKAMARMRGEDPSSIKLRPWVVHDLRRTLRTHLSGLKVLDHISEMVIGHGRQGLQRVYDQWRYVGEMREALTLWAARLRSIVEPPPANVVSIRVRG